TIKTINSTGAGDAFLGGMMAGLHHGLKWRDVFKLANACGAACCETLGAPPDPDKNRAPGFDLYDGAPFDAPQLKKVESPTAAPSISPYQNAVPIFLDIAIEELGKLRAKIGDENYFKRAADLIEQVESRGGRLHVTGIGKPEYVAGYAAALLSSTGA